LRKSQLKLFCLLAHFVQIFEFVENTHGGFLVTGQDMSSPRTSITRYRVSLFGQANW
jgi:hypothetical protein